MGTTREQISAWFDAGVEKGATHMFIVCDTFDYTDHPAYVKPGQDARDTVVQYCRRNAMTRVMEVYNLKLDKNKQLSQVRAFNY